MSRPSVHVTLAAAPPVRVACKLRDQPCAIDPLVSKNRGGFQGPILYAVGSRGPCPRHFYVSPRRRRARVLTMIKLFSLKQAKKDGESPKAGTQKKASAAQLRITKGSDTRLPVHGVRDATRAPARPLSRLAFLFSDINELNLPKTCGTEFPDPDDLLSFKLIICPDEVSRNSSGAPYGPYGRSSRCLFLLFSLEVCKSFISVDNPQQLLSMAMTLYL